MTDDRWKENRTVSALGLALLAAFVGGEFARAQESKPAAQSPAAATREVVDELRRRVRVPQEVRRIISLAPNLTETLYALGAQERLVGVSDFCDWPPETRAKPKVGGNLNPNLEQIVALRPDLVLMAKTANRLETVEALERLGITVYGTRPDTVEQVLASTQRVAELLGLGETGEALVEQWRGRLAGLEQRLAGRAPRRVLFVVWHEPLVSVGRGSFLADALRRAGSVPAVETDQEWPRLSLEEVIKAQPDYLVFSASHSEQVRRTVEDLRGRPGWRSLQAIREGRTAVVSEAIIRPGPRLVEIIEQLARQLHPDAFAKMPEEQKTKSGKRKTEGMACRRSNFALRFPIFAFRFSPGRSGEFLR